jgi:hypothetical protein
MRLNDKTCVANIGNLCKYYLLTYESRNLIDQKSPANRLPPKSWTLIGGIFMAKNRKHGTEFKLQIVEEHLKGHSANYLSKKWDISKSLIRKWIDHHASSGAKGLQPKRYNYYTKNLN